MATVTLSLRITQAEARKLKRLAAAVGLDRSTLLKQSLRRGCADVLFETACETYRRGEVTLSRAAEMADLSLREMVLRLSRAGLELSYGTEDLRRDLEK